MLRLEFLQTEFLAGLASQRILHVFAVIHMTAYGRVPFAGLNILPFRTALQIETHFAVEHVQMHHRMKQLRASMTFAPRGLSYHSARFIHHRKCLL